MKTIWKYPIPMGGFTLEMPANAHILTVQTQDGSPFLWAMVDTEAPTVERRFTVRGTGHGANGVLETAYIGTFQLLDGAFIGHLFEQHEATS